MADISFMDILGGATAPEGGEEIPSEGGATGEMGNPFDILSGIDIGDIIEFLKSKEILPPEFKWEGEKEASGAEEPMEMEGEETTEDSLSFDKMFVE